MSLRAKILLLVVMLNLVATLSLNLFVQKAVIPQISAYKEHLLEKRVKTVIRLIDDQINKIDNSVRDYAYWDDTYEFMQTYNQDYVDSNLGKQTFANIEVDYIGFFDVLGELYFHAGYKHGTDNKFDIPEELSRKLEDLSFTLYSENTNALGVITSGDSVFLVISRPILKSDKTGPAVGTLMMIREYDPELNQVISNLVQDPYQIDLYSKIEGYLSNKLKAQILDRVFTIEKTNNGLKVYSLVNGIDKDPSIVISMAEDASLVALEKTLVKNLNFILLVIFILSMVLVFFFVDKYFLGPLRFLVTEVDRIRTRKVGAQRISIKAYGELQKLVTSINTMLDALDSFDKKLVTVNKEMEEKTKELEDNAKEMERINRHMVGRELRMAELKEQIEDLEFKLNEKHNDIQ